MHLEILNLSGGSEIRIHQLGRGDIDLMHSMLDLYGAAFEDNLTYGSARPDFEYLDRLLGLSSFIAIAALDGETVIGALTAYELPKFEQARSEIYIYDLAVVQSHRRRGIATAMIHAVRKIAAERGAWVIVIQADRDDEAPIALYDRLGTREEVLHYDMTPLADSETAI